MLTVTGVDLRPIMDRWKFVFIAQVGSPQIVLRLHKTRNLHAVESPQKAVYDVRDNTAPWGIALDILIRGR